MAISNNELYIYSTSYYEIVLTKFWNVAEIDIYEVLKNYKTCVHNELKSK